MRKAPGLCLTAIVWIARPCVDYSTELIMNFLNVLRANALSFYTIKFHFAIVGEFDKESFHGYN